LNKNLLNPKKFIFHKILILCLFCYYLFIFPLPVEASSIAVDSKDFSERVLQIIQDNPDIVYKAIESHYQKQIEEQKENRISLLRELRNSKEFIGNSPIQGMTNSRVILSEFSDFQCPYCAEAHKTLKQFVATHKDQVALVYKHYPIGQIHKEAIPAATASWAAHQQNKFWQYQDFLFAHQDQLGENLYLQTAKNLGLDLVKFERDRKSQEAMTAIQKDVELAERLGISGTPFFVMNEEVFSGAVQGSFLEDKLTKM
jgi:protein-disulfide isomerase